MLGWLAAQEAKLDFDVETVYAREVDLSMWFSDWTASQADAFRRMHPAEFEAWSTVCIGWMEDFLDEYEQIQSAPVEMHDFIVGIASGDRQPSSSFCVGLPRVAGAGD